jgi:hypothetical protein
MYCRSSHHGPLIHHMALHYPHYVISYLVTQVVNGLETCNCYSCYCYTLRLLRTYLMSISWHHTTHSHRQAFIYYTFVATLLESMFVCLIDTACHSVLLSAHFVPGCPGLTLRLDQTLLCGARVVTCTCFGRHWA